MSTRKAVSVFQNNEICSEILAVVLKKQRCGNGGDNYEIVHYRKGFVTRAGPCGASSPETEPLRSYKKETAYLLLCERFVSNSPHEALAAHEEHGLRALRAKFVGN